MTSRMMTRLCDSAVVCRRSMASVAICTAVWKPKVTSVPARSLSIVLGTPTTGTLSAASRRRDAERVLAADGDQGIDALPLERLAHQRGAVALALVGIGARRPEDRAAAVQDARRVLRRQLDRVGLEHAGPAVAEADDLMAMAVDPGAHDATDHRVEAGAVAAAGEDAEARHRARHPAKCGRRSKRGSTPVARLVGFQARATRSTTPSPGASSSDLATASPSRSRRVPIAIVPSAGRLAASEPRLSATRKPSPRR